MGYTCFQCFLVSLYCLFVASSAGEDALADAIKKAVKPKKVVKQLNHLASFSDAPKPAVTRVLFSKADMEARSYVVELMEAVGLEVRTDPMGNIFGRWEGAKEDQPVIMTGSHIDAIPMSGMYDGTVGVLGAIHAIEILKKADFTPRNPIEVLMFTSEEPTRFQLSCVGSRALSGALTSATLKSRLDENGVSFLEAANEAGYGGHSLSDILMKSALNAREISSFIELHIEQGPLLEDQRSDIGIVTAIAAPSTIKVSFSGDGGHAGALLMHYRNDAGLAAAELSLFVEKSVLATESADTVGTTGRLEIEPNAVNSVPREARLEIDIRDVDQGRRDAVVKEIQDEVVAIATRRKVKHTFEIVNQDPPETCSSQVTFAIKDASRALGHHSISMVSRAYHDALFMARIAPTGMIFIPCKEGISHRPDEFASEDAIAKGIEVLALTIANISGTAEEPSPTPEPKKRHSHHKPAEEDDKSEL